MDRVPGGEEGSGVFRVGGISYLRIPADHPGRIAAFYEAVFGWSTAGRDHDWSFETAPGT
jgi:predicted enzyme related to lactoylglutathione lyase